MRKTGGFRGVRQFGHNGPVTTSTRLPRVRASELVGRSWLNTGGRTLTLADLRGKIVILDFWTFCCVNCLHVLDELRELEERHRDELVIVGVHSPKFVHEADPDALAAAVERYDVRHPVLDDPELVTWSAYTARAWPTLVVIDPEGYVVAQMAGEGHASAVEALVGELIAEHEAKGTLHRGDGPFVPQAPEPSTLRFPAKAIALANGNLLVADAGHHSLAELAPDAETLVRRIGSGRRGLLDGGPDEAQFNEPNGLCLVPADLRDRFGDVLVADTVNHLIRGVRLDTGEVSTVAGAGGQFMVGGMENVAGPDGNPTPRPFDPAVTYDLDGVRLSSPWDITWSQSLGAFIVAMAGNHSLWAFDGWNIRLLAGTMHEGREDGQVATAWFAQPSGLAVGPDGRVWIADSETSSLRWLDGEDAGISALGDGLSVHTAVGQGLFDFGHVDGPAAAALLQHPLGIAVLPDGSVVIADTYNGAIRHYDPDTQEVTTLATGLAEPSGVVVQVDTAEAGRRIDLLVVESAAHRITRIQLPAVLTGTILDGGAHRTRRPVTAIRSGVLRLEIPFTAAAGQKLDYTFGSPLELRVSATPPELLVDGAGTGTEFTRELVINGQVPTGVLHITARAQSCDIVPEGMEDEIFPACHLAQQDWGVPVEVTASGATTLRLPLRG